MQRESIPVGCVPSAFVVVGMGPEGCIVPERGMVLERGMVAKEGMVPGIWSWGYGPTGVWSQGVWSKRGCMVPEGGIVPEDIWSWGVLLYYVFPRVP